MLLQASDLCQRLQKEALLTKIKGNPENYFLLVQWGIGSQQPVAWRAAWLLKQLTKQNDPRLHPYIDDAIRNYPDFNESQKREWLKIFINQTLDESQEGALFDLCLAEWQKISNHPALRASAMTLVFQVVRNYPELMQEVGHLMHEEYLSALSPGIRKSLGKQWSKLQQSNKC